MFTEGLSTPLETKAPKQVSAEALLAYLRSAYARELSFGQLPWSLLLCLMYALMAVTVEPQRESHSVEHAINFDIEENANFAFEGMGHFGHKTFEDANSIADFWSWMRLGFVPLLVKDSVAISEGLKPGDLKLGPRTPQDGLYYLEHLRIVGGIRFRTQSARTKDCANPDLVKAIYQTTDKTEFRCSDTLMNLDFHPDTMDYIYNPISHHAGGTHWLHVRQNGTSCDTMLKTWEKERFLNGLTERVELMFPVYSANTNTLSLASVNFFFTTSGHIWKKVASRSVFLPPFRADAMIFSAIFYLIVLSMFIAEFFEIAGLVRHRSKHHSKTTALKSYLGPWQIVDWLTIIGGLWILVIHVRMMVRVVDVEDSLLNAVGIEEEASSCTALSSSPDCYADLEKFVQQIWDSLQLQEDLVYLNGTYPLIIMLRLFKAFSAQPRLAIVTKTLWAAGSDLVHFGIVFFSIFFSYAVMGSILFGRTIEYFSTIPRSMFSLFRALFGDLDVDELAQEGKIITAPFYISFVVVLVLVMFNMLVAIFMDVYSEVKEDTSLSTPINRQILRLFHRRREIQQGKRVPFRKLVRLVTDRIAEDAKSLGKSEDEVDDRLLTASQLQAMVPGLGDEQVAEIMTRCEEQLIVNGVKDKEEKSDVLNDAIANTENWMLHEISAIREQLSQIKVSI